ncbi:hypothetical protein SPI_09201 [Niveomyces insectorum RCEF 264]|uniref:Acetate kinase n=1 Tax=Niveomyces insectorum RCEF 264 TaxID=1081102 RepID=A0A167M099_9HYPO|nr:hypothetical protein SPI_09201 [Niveomyces insectorum RCEF 264]
MAASGSSSSSYAASSLGYPPSSAYTYTSTNASVRTPSSSAASAVSAVTSNSSAPPPTPLRPLDLGPPGYQATIILFERTPNEATVYLGPWEIVNTEPRRIRWQCSYQGEVLEHFLPSNNPADIFPHTLHARHRPYGEPSDMELYLTFLEPHRIRYVTSDNTLVHDDHVEVKYEFTTTEGSHRFQSDLRGQDLVDHFDLDVLWSDRDSRTDSFGSVRGIGSIQRLKMWRDRYTTYHYLTFYANRTDRRYREYLVYAFDTEIKNRDDSHRRLRINARERRGRGEGSGGSGSGSTSQASGGGGGGSSSSSHSTRRFSMSSLRQRPRTSTSGQHHHHHHNHTHNNNNNNSSSHSSHGSRHHHRHDSPHSSSHASISRSSQSQSEHGSTVSPPSTESSFSPGSGLDIRYLGIQFTRSDDYYRFIEQWALAQSADAEFCGVPFPSDRFELPSPEIYPGDNPNAGASSSVIGLPIAEEPPGSSSPT